MKAEYQRPVKGTLMVMLPDGEMWEATDEDVARFNLVNRYEAYHNFDKHLTEVLSEAGLLERGDLTRTALNPLRYLVELAVCHPDLLAHPEMDSTDRDVVLIEKALIEAGLRDED